MWYFKKNQDRFEKTMNRREFVKTIILTLFTGQFVPQALANKTQVREKGASERFDSAIKDYLYKMQHFDQPHGKDVCVELGQIPSLRSSVARLKRLQRLVGHGNFHLLSFDEAIQIARNHTQVGPFSKPERRFLEMVFYADASRYGFTGKKPLTVMTDRVRRQDVVKIRSTGNYIFKGAPLETYRKIMTDLGDQAVLTSGVRGVTKQFMLFLNKALQHNGNLSLASRSLAPPGYSYHGIGDFDVGQMGFGAANFTERFTTTEVCKKLGELGYIDLRYQRNNRLGVRFEPWHIKVALG